MCDTEKGPEKKVKNSREIKDGFCHKCKTMKPIVRIRNTLFCKSCFQDSVVHRFRTNLFKLKKVPKNPRVLLAYSGGNSSSCLLELMAEFSRIDLNFEKRRPRYPFVHVCHVDQSAIYNNDIASDIEQYVTEKQLGFSTIKIESIFNSKVQFQRKKGVDLISKDSTSSSSKELLLESLKSISYSSQEDLIGQYTLNALISEAKRLHCNMIMYGDNATLMAIRVIANTAKGRGISLANEIALEHLDDDILHVRPIRDILAKEIGFFNQYRDLKSFAHPNITTGMNSHTSIDRLTADFIIGLEDEFPSTVSTITRTAYKIPPTDVSALAQCVIYKPSGFSKIESAFVPDSGCQDCDCSKGCSTGCSTPDSIDISSLVCYGCKNITLEMQKAKKGTFPSTAWDSASRQLSQEKMKETIAEYLLDDEE